MPSNGRCRTPYHAHSSPNVNSPVAEKLWEVLVLSSRSHCSDGDPKMLELWDREGSQGAVVLPACSQQGMGRVGAAASPSLPSEREESWCQCPLDAIPGSLVLLKNNASHTNPVPQDSRQGGAAGHHLAFRIRHCRAGSTLSVFSTTPAIFLCASEEISRISSCYSILQVW